MSNKPPALITTFPKRLHRGRIAVLAANAADQPSLRNSAEQRRWTRQLACLRLRRLCRVQLRARDGNEPFLTSVDVALDHRDRIRAAFVATPRASWPTLLRRGRDLRFIAVPGTGPQRRPLLAWRQRVIALPAIDDGALRARGFSRQHEPRELRCVGHDALGRPMLLAAAAATAWGRMREDAANACIALEPISTFRSVAYQRGLIARKLKRGDTLAQILAVNAAPGFSEHHSGCAIDIGTPGCAALDEAFEQTPAFAWLLEHAPGFGFRLSYPRGNALGVIYEPWHWFYVGATG